MPVVLLLCEYPTLSGGERSMLAALAAVRQAGFAAQAVAPSGGPLADALRRHGVQIVGSLGGGPAGSRPPSGRRDQLRTLLARCQPDLLHANSLAMARLAGPVTAEANVPGIGHLRDIIKLSGQAVADLNCLSRLLAVSHATRDFHVAQGVDAERVFVLYNGVDLTEYQPRPPTGYLHRDLRIPESAALVGSIGQIGPRKGLDVLLEAAVRVCREHKGVHFLVVGQRWSGKDESRRFEEDLRTRAARWLPGRFHRLGFRHDVPRLMNELALLVHPARQEPLGRVLLEAAASGVAVVATDVGGTREIFPPESGSAWLVPPDDPQQLAAAIARLLGDRPLRQALAAAARRRAETVFDARQTSAVLVDHYRQLLCPAR